ncbi:CPBP family intramembrane glutamic endopeptidase [Clostridium felsineum]|uniref:CPBP family intramembrane glutamic endopeptidase n=1 Tax=Clostridium felsineum TaxID=36839 RepID=UPI00098BCEF8|nr:CPBP family intramembrane glutamic endopeptidase [Clostridium felsineum]URZ00082.1 hypothetical protein CLAUR_000650 [Clostridium felsineum]
MKRKKYIGLYIVFVLLITWCVTLALFINYKVGQKFFFSIMYIPGILAFIFNIIEYKNIKKTCEVFTKKINKKAVLFSIFYPIAVVFLCSFIVYMLGIGLIQSRVNTESLGKLVANGKILFRRDIIVLIVASIMTIPDALGEEYGWRGYLLKESTFEFGITKSVIIVGVVWALYHVPIVFLLAKYSGIANPFLLCLVQGLAAFAFSFPEAYSFYLSGNVLLPVILHAVWNSINVMVLGDIYKNEHGIMSGKLLLINGEGIIGVILGVILIFVFIRVFKKKEDNCGEKYADQ